MFSNYTKKAKEVLKYAKEAALEMGSGNIGSEHLLIGLVQAKGSTASEILISGGVDIKALTELTTQMLGNGLQAMVADPDLYTPRAQKILEQAEKEAKRFGSDMVGTEHILIAVLKGKDSVADRFLTTLGVNTKKVYYDAVSALGQDPNETAKEDFLQKNSLSEGSGTPTLDKYCKDLTAMATLGELDPVIGRETEIERVIQILNRRTKNNPCLIGDPGVGKTAVIEGIAQRIVEGKVPGPLLNKRLVSLDLSGMVAGSKYRGEFEERIKNVIREVVEDGEVLMFLDEMHTIVGAGSAEGAIDASNILKPYLARGEFQLIGATTGEEYRKYIEKDASLERRFQTVTINEPTEDEAIEILKGLRPLYESFHGVTISDEALESAVKLSRRYISERFLPDKAIDLIDEASSKAGLKEMENPADIEKAKNEINKLEDEKEEAIRKKDFELAAAIRKTQKKKKENLELLIRKNEKNKELNRTVIGEDEIAQVVSMWTKLPVSKLTQKEYEKLASLEDELHKRIIGQDEAVVALSNAIRRGRLGISDENRPIGSFLFLGPTGVGKTELSKALAQCLFGTEKSLIRVDMSEYMEKHSVSKMIGSPPGYVGFEEGGQLSEKIRKNPYSVLLFDEIEKAHPDIFNVLLQVLDDGRITDNEGRVIDFKNTVIIMTSNIGARSIVEPKNLGFETERTREIEYKDMKSKVMDDVKREFKPEFINRIDDIIVFDKLSKEEIMQITENMLKKLTERVKESTGVTLSIARTAKEHIVNKGFDVKYGARPLRRQIQRDVEDVIAKMILNSEATQGDRITVSASGDKLKFTVKRK